MREFKPTETRSFEQGRVRVHIENSPEQFAWQLEVDGDKSAPSTHYAGILVHKGYGLATVYWSPDFEEFVPFKIVYADA